MFYSDIVWSASNYPRNLDPLADDPGCGTVRYHQLGDCHNDECIESVAGKVTNVCIISMSADLMAELMLPDHRKQIRF